MLKFKRFGPHRTERGLSLLEVGMALVLAAVVMAGSAWYATSAAQKMKRRTDAQTLMVVARASQAYIVKNSGAWLAAGLVPGTIKDYGVSDLQTDGELSTSISGELSNEQQLRLLIQAVPNPAHVNDPNTAAYVIKGLLVSYTTRNAGRPFTDDEAGQIVSLAGAAGGFVSSKIDSNNVDGANGAWKESVASWNDGTYTPTAGHVAALVNMSYSAADGNSNNGPWLVRKAGLSPQFSQLDPGVHIDMNSNVLENASLVQANEYVGQTPGADINIGSITNTPNINIGGANSTSQINLNANDPSGTINLNANGASGTNSGINLNATGGNASVPTGAINGKAGTYSFAYGQTYDITNRTGEGLHLSLLGTGDPNGSGGSSYWAAQEIRFRTRWPTTGVWGDIMAMAGGENTGVICVGMNVYVDANGLASCVQEPPDNLSFYTNIFMSGDIMINGSWMGSSDRRLKMDIKPLGDDALNEIEQLHGYSFKWKRNGKPDIGVIAQEVEKVFPQLVANGVGGMKAVAYSNLVAPLIEAVKTLHHMLNDAVARIDVQIAALQQDDRNLQTQVQALTKQNTELKAEVAAQRLDLIKLKYAVHQPLSADERTVCGAACLP